MPLVLDFRDSWTDDPYLILPTKFHRWVHEKLEKIVLGHAKHFIVYADWLKKYMKSVIQEFQLLSS